ncbi:MAG: hypothetical protein K6E75_03570 [Lachnospiraceae bacterium]|nr:hypothetical protein [Lachnospiraceae bacterium]
MQLAKWGKRKLKLTAKQVANLQKLTYTGEYDTEKSAVKKKGLEVEYDPMVELGINPTTEITNWNKDLGKSNPFYVGTKRFGPKKFTLISVSSSEIDARLGKIRGAKIRLTFQEAEGKKKSGSSTKKSSKKKTKTTAKKTASKKKKKKK